MFEITSIKRSRVAVTDALRKLTHTLENEDDVVDGSVQMEVSRSYEPDGRRRTEITIWYED